MLKPHRVLTRFGS